MLVVTLSLLLRAREIVTCDPLSPLEGEGV